MLSERSNASYYRTAIWLAFTDCTAIGSRSLVLDVGNFRLGLLRSSSTAAIVVAEEEVVVVVIIVAQAVSGHQSNTKPMHEQRSSRF